MSTTMSAPSSTSSAAPALLDQDWRRIGKWGGLCAMAIALISLIGMPVGLTFAGRAYSDNALLTFAAAFEATGSRRIVQPRTPALG